MDAVTKIYCNKLMGHVLKASEQKGKSYILYIEIISTIVIKEKGVILCMGKTILGQDPVSGEAGEILYVMDGRILRYKLLPKNTLQTLQNDSPLIRDFLFGSGAKFVE